MTSGVSYGLTLRPNVSFASCSRVGWSVPELGTNLGTNSIRRNFLTGNCLKIMVGRDGIEPLIPGFSDPTPAPSSDI